MFYEINSFGYFTYEEWLSDGDELTSSVGIDYRV